MFINHLITTPFTNILDQNNIVAFSYTNLTTEPSILHKNSITEILFPVSGEGTLQFQYQSVPFIQNHFYIINPNTAHTEKTKTALQYYVLQLENVSLTNCDNRFLDFTLSHEQYSALFLLLSNAMSELENKNIYSDKIAHLYLTTFYLQIKRLLFNHNQQLIKKRNKFSTSELVNEVKKYISDNCGLDLKISQVAKHFAVSANNLTIKFKQETGITPQQFLLNNRVEVGKYLLLTSDYNITQITALCGFNSPAHFAEIFKQIEGVSPTKYRLKNIKGSSS